MTTWRKLLDEFDDYISYNTLSNEQLDAEFDSEHGQSQPFTAWSTRFVYFPVLGNTLARVPRSPCDEAARHIGGE